jgi:hypothetical protein
MSGPVLSTGLNIFYTFTGFTGLSQNQRTKIQLAWNFFEMVQNSNAIISTANSGVNGDTRVLPIPFYTFTSNTEKNTFLLGQYYHQQAYPQYSFETIR